MSRTAIRNLARLLMLLSAGAACGNDNGPGEAASIRIGPKPAMIDQGGTLQLTATVVDRSGHRVPDQAVEWSSSNDAIATVSSTGLVTSAGPRDPVSIIATQGEISDSIDLDVLRVPAEIRVSPDSTLLNVGEQANLVIEVFDVVGDPYPVDEVTVEASSNVVIRLEGITVTALVPGEATVTIRLRDLVKVVPIVVRVIPSSIETSGVSKIYTPGETQQITATVRDRRGIVIPGSTITYTSTNPTVVSVSPAGLITALGPSGSGRVRIQSDALEYDLGFYVGSLPAAAGVIGTATVPGSPYSVAVNSSGRMLLSLVAGGPIARMGNAASFSFPDTVLLTSLDSRGVALNPAGTRGYVATDLGIAVIDMAASTREAFIPRPGIHPVLSTFVTLDGATLLGGGDGGIYRFNAATRAVTDSLKVLSVLEMVQHPTQQVVYAMSPNQVAEVQLGSYTSTRSFSPGTSNNYRGVAISPDGSELYVADEFDRLIVVSTATMRQIGSVAIGGVYGVTVLGNTIVAAGNGHVYFIDRASLVNLRTLDINVDRRPVVGPGGVLIIPGLSAGQVFFVQ